MQIILFSSAINFNEEISLVNSFLLDKRLIFHIRKPGLSLEELTVYINKIHKKFHSQLVIHQHIDLLTKFNLKGFHCSRYFIDTYKIELLDLKVRFPEASFSKSCHSLADLKNIAGYSYVFLSPIFNSISKQGYTSSFNFDEVNRVISQLKTPIYALGGVSDKEISKLKSSNFSGIGILGYIWNSTTAIENYKKLKNNLLFN